MHEITETRGVGATALSVVATADAAANATANAAANAAAAIVPRVGVRIRPGTPADVPWIDAMQKAHGRELGFLPLMALAGKVRLGQVLVAEEVGSRRKAVGGEEAEAEVGGRRKAVGGEEKEADGPSSSAPPTAYCLPPTSLGYLIASDRYYKRDEVGCVTQINVLPEYRRSLVAAALLQAQFDRSAYGCRLYCCWCAQDLKANAFWEAMGFTPIAFRTGSRTKGESRQKAEDGGQNGPGPSSPPNAYRSLPTSARIHIFWQKRVRAGDVSTPWWYPAKTEGGEMREDRLVFPIPPGTHWRDVLPVVLPETANASVRAAEIGTGDGASEGSGATVCGTPQAVLGGENTALGTRPWHPTGRASRGRSGAEKTPLSAEQIAKNEADRAAARERVRERVRLNPPRPVRPAGVPRGAMWAAPKWDDYQPTDAEIDAELALAAKVRRRTTKKESAAPERTVDPRLVAMARELRDRWIERADGVLALPGRHDVRKAIASPTAAALPVGGGMRALPDAAMRALPDGTIRALPDETMRALPDGALRALPDAA